MRSLHRVIRGLPLRFLIPGSIFLVGMATISISFYLQWLGNQERIVRDMSYHVRVVGMTLSGQIEAAMRARDPGDVHAVIESIQGDADLVQAAVLGPEGRIVAATRIETINSRLDQAGNEDLAALVQSVRDEQMSRLRTAAGQRLQAVFPLRFRRSPQTLLPDATGYLAVEYDMSQHAALHNRQLLLTAASQAAVITILCLLLWLLVHHRLLKPVRHLGRVARRIGEGDFSSRPDDSGNDELGQLAHEFNSMARRLEQNTRELSYQSLHDNLTGLLNRWGFERAMQSLLQRLPYSERVHVLIYLDLDQFRVINETWGHSAGDELLRQIAQNLNDKVFKRDFIARLGGDEFAILLDDCPEEVAAAKAHELRKMVEDFRFHWQGNVLRITCSLGVVPIRKDVEHTDSLFSLADSACYVAKQAGRNRVHVWQEGDEQLQRFHGEMRWVSRIHSALEEDRFLLYAQPIVPVGADDRQMRYEILVRLKDENGDVVPPGEFLPAAENYHLAAGIDRWVIEHTVRKLASNPEHVRHLDMCTINLSGLSLNDSTLLDFIGRALDRTDPLLPRNICFEITETAAITHLGQAAHFIRQMKSLGCRFALDDFGSGVSSFGYLKNLAVDYIKIDGMFVRDLLIDPVDAAVVAAINEIGHKMGKQTIAEFVESPRIAERLAEIGVDYAQGYGIEKPLPLDELLRTVPK